MRKWIFAVRCGKEIFSDRVNLILGLSFPVALILLLTAIQRNIPVVQYDLQTLTPAMSVFGLSFITLFSATMVAKDRESAFLHRLYTTPMTSSDFILGYVLAMLPCAMGQGILCYLCSALLGLEFTIGCFYAWLGLFPTAIFYICLGILCGSVLTVKQVGGVCGALLTNLSAWLSGAWFDLNLIGGVFYKIAMCLPFVHAVRWEQSLLCGNWGDAVLHFLPLGAYTIIAAVGAVMLFLRQMKNQ